MPKIRLDLPVLLPAIPDERDACVTRLLTILNTQAGIAGAHLLEGDPPQVCLHYDPSQVTIAKVEALARQAGAEITARYGHLLLDVAGVRHQRHARHLGERLSKRPGILEAVVSGAGLVRVEYDQQQYNAAAVMAEIADLGLSIVDSGLPQTAGVGLSPNPTTPGAVKPTIAPVGLSPKPTAPGAAKPGIAPVGLSPKPTAPGAAKPGIAPVRAFA